MRDALKFALDEDVSHPLASLLRSQGETADSAKELGRLGLRDAQVLLLAAEHGQALVTHNNRDFRMLHDAWMLWRRRWSDDCERSGGQPHFVLRHAGILIVPHLKNHDLASVLDEFGDIAASPADRLFAWSPVRRWHEIHV